MAESKSVAVTVLKFPRQDGAIVTEVYEGGPAFQAGLRPGDAIVELNGNAIRSASEVHQQIQLLPVGTPAQFKYNRNGKEESVAVQVLPRPLEAEMSTRWKQKAQALEQAGISAEWTGRLREALDNYHRIIVLYWWFPDLIPRVSERIIKVSQRLEPPAAVPEGAEHYRNRGAALLKKASSDEDVDRAVQEFANAWYLAPWWGDAYFNLAVAQEKAGRPLPAAQNLRLYLLATPNAEDATTVKAKIAELEIDAEMEGPWKRFEGRWNFKNGAEEDLKIRGRKFQIVTVKPGQNRLEKPGDVVAYGTINRSVMEGKVVVRPTNANEQRCFGSQHEKPLKGAISSDGRTLTLTYHDITRYKIQTCEKLAEGEVNFRTLSKSQ
jgi:hypothetical protein